MRVSLYNEPVRRDLIMQALSWKLAAMLMASTIAANAATKLTHADFGSAAGVPVRIYTLTNKNGIEARITNYGGIVVSLKTPDRNGALADIVLGFDSVAGYV